MHFKLHTHCVVSVLNTVNSGCFVHAYIIFGESFLEINLVY